MTENPYPITPVALTPTERKGTAKRAGSWDEFERRFQPVEGVQGCLIRDYHEIKDSPISYVWTIVEGDGGGLYLEAGYHFVNRLGYVIAGRPRLTRLPKGAAYKTFIYQ